MLGSLLSTDGVSGAERRRGLKLLLYDGICSQVMAAMTGGAFLVAFALLNGASNTSVGLIAAISPLSQLLQLPAVLLVNRVRQRKALAVASAVTARCLWLVIAVIPWLLAERFRLPALLGALTLFFALGAVTSCSWNSWMRDLVPMAIRGRYLGRRLSVATMAAAAVSLLAGLAIDWYGPRLPSPAAAYSILLAGGGVVGLIGIWFLSLVPEPTMLDTRSRPLRDILRDPLRDPNYRHLIVFLGSWNFAVNLAAPFFVVYMLRRLQLELAAVAALAVLSQFCTAYFLGVWGKLSDRLSSKSVLSVTGFLFLLSIILWPLTDLPAAPGLTLPLLAIIHMLAGMSTAGVTLCSSTLALKAAPRGEATAYLATNALASGTAAAIAPVAAGFAADWFADKELSVSFRWIAAKSGLGALEFSALDLRGLDFLFVVAFVVGLYAMHRLLAVQERGEVKEGVVISALYAEVRRTARDVSNIPGLRQLTEFPYALLGRIRERRHRRRSRRPPTAEELAMRETRVEQPQ